MGKARVNYLLRIAGSPDDAQDVSQEAFLKAYQTWRGWTIRRGLDRGCTGLRTTKRSARSGGGARRRI
jgi:DNA-directed RNA polymerase specialized sigma24 family protein